MTLTTPSTLFFIFIVRALFKVETIVVSKHHKIEAYGRMKIKLHAFTLQVYGDDSHLRVPGNVPLVPIEFEAGWAPEPIWMV